MLPHRGHCAISEWWGPMKDGPAHRQMLHATESDEGTGFERHGGVRDCHHSPAGAAKPKRRAIGRSGALTALTTVSGSEGTSRS